MSQSPRPETPPQEAQPRSMIVYFQEFKIKELVLHSAWKKKEVFLGQSRIYFDRDYPAETLAKRKAYAQIRQLLREKGIRFQTPPPAKLRVFFESGPITYETAADAAEDLKMRGFQFDPERTQPGNAAKPPRPSWQRAAVKTNRQVRQDRIKEKLREFQRPR